MTEPTFTKDALEETVARNERGYHAVPLPIYQRLAAFALRLMAERDELQATYDLFSEAWRRADAIWVAQDPEQRSKRRPGLAEQIVWLVAELEKAEAEHDKARRELAELRSSPAYHDPGMYRTLRRELAEAEKTPVRRALERKP